MSPLFAAMPPADLPTVAYVPTGIHAAELVMARQAETHTVRSGDTVYGIAARYGVSAQTIVRANGLPDGGRWILPGATLVIPGAKSGGGTASAPLPGASGSSSPSSTVSSAPASRKGSTTVTVRHGDTLSHIAARHGTSVSALARANGLRDSRLIYPGQVLTVPGSGGKASSGGSKASSSAKASSGTKASPTSSSPGGSVTVRAGDTLSGIAAKHGVSVSAIARTNGISTRDFIYPGQKLRLPGDGKASSSSSGTTSSDSSSKASSRTKASSSTKTPTSSGPGGSVTVRAGDTLSGIAAKHGVSVSAIARTNGISARGFIYPGQKLRLPGGATASADAAQAKPLDRPYDESTIGDRKKGEKVENTFLHYRYSDGVARSAAANREYLASIDVPSRTEMKKIIVETSKRYGVDHKLMLALSYQESGWNMRAVSAANAIGAMQVIPASGQWASSIVGRELNLLDPHDNVEAGVVIIKTLQGMTDEEQHAIGGYYQGLGSVREHGLFPDTKQYVRNIQHFRSRL